MIDGPVVSAGMDGSWGEMGVMSCMGGTGDVVIMGELTAIVIRWSTFPAGASA